MSLQRKILRGSTLNLLDHVARVGSMLVVTPLMVTQLGLEGYGIWLVLTAAVSFLNLLDGGITLSGTRYLARSLGRGDTAEVDRVTGTLRWLYRRVGLACLAATGLLVLAVPWLVRDPVWQQAARQVLLALGLGMALRFFLRIHLVILKSHVRYDLIVAASIAKILVQTSLILWLLTRGHGLVVLALAQILSDLIDQCLVVLFSRRTQPPAKSRACRELLPDILRYSGLAFLNSTGQHLRSRIDPFVLSAFVGVASVPVYNMGLRLVTLFFDVVNALMGGTLLAGFSQVEGRSGLDGVREKFLLSLRFSIPLALFGATGLAVLGPAFLVCWLGPEFAESGTVLRLLVPPYTLWLMQFPAGSVFLSLNRHHLITRLTFAAGLFNALLSALLASQIGLHGVVWATFIDMTLFYGIAVPLLLCRVLDLRPLAYLRTLLRPALQVGPVLAAVAWLAAPWLRPDYGSLAFAGLILGTVFAVATWFLLLNGEERRALRLHRRL
jgi:O-antigen/teichoic acid export membrane protein